MKRLVGFFIILLFFLIGFFYWFFFSQKTQPVSEIKESTTIKKGEKNFESFNQGMKSLTFQDNEFLFLSQQVSQPQELKLYPNFEEKLSSTLLFENYKCSFLTNGGFYSQENQPLAWFFTQEKLFKKAIKSAFFNGFLALNKDNTFYLGEALPTNEISWGLQTGPLLIFESKPLPLNLAHDESDRRIVAALNSKNELFFLVITRSDSLAFGPLLKNLPLIVQKIALDLNEEFQTAVNLDGGTASAFLTPVKNIKEYTWIGSFFCLQSDN